jgi:hypothetical protein
MLNPKDPRFISQYKGDDLKRLLVIFPNSDATRLEKVISAADGINSIQE